MEVFEGGAALGQGSVEHGRSRPIHQAIERHEGRRRLGGQATDPAFCGVQAHLQRIEAVGAADLDHQLAVEHEALLRQGAEPFGNLGEEPRQGLAGLGLELDRVAIAVRQAAETVPLGFELPAAVAGKFRRRFRFHRGGVERD